MTHTASSHTSKPTALRNKRIGRKVLLADRLAHALGTTTPSKATKNWRGRLLRPRLIATVLAGVFVLGALGVTVLHSYSTRLADEQKNEAAKQIASQKERAAKADACRRAKAEQKADLIGKVTYDELYDNDECDR